ncbi:Nn.00g034620.m01.CDS01 [Neocucurbitaria sp. VM-36]
MAPLRRYLRITKHSVLEVRIYLDRPADAEAWLLKRDNPALPRVIQAIRPLVLPKLREENERGKGHRGAKAKKKGVKDVVVEDDFEVSIFLTELSSRHSVLTKQKIFKDKARIQSNSGKLTGWLTTGTSDQPVVINEEVMEPIVIREEEAEEAINLADIPEADIQQNQPQRSVRNASDSEGSDLFVPGPSTKQRKTSRRLDTSNQDEDDEVSQDDDKKKLGLITSYDGFSIYGRILCLVVKRRGVRNQVGGGGVPSSQAMLENWVSTQAAVEHIDDDEDGG